MLTSIWKTPVDGPVRAAHSNLFGDEQSDLTVHGGPRKAVYAYPSEHYEYWRRQLPGADLSWGGFGENLSTEGLIESELAVGDRLRIGSAELVVTQPRMPCYKLGIRFGDDLMVKRFMRSGRSGVYFSIAIEGLIQAGDPIAVVSRAEDRLTISDLFASRLKDL
ncbi:MAG TPA: MOSC domain-containing protein [Vicinamibacterales bacterium]